MRPFLALMLVLCACRNEEFRVLPAPPELVEVELDRTGYRLVFMFPEGWARVAAAGPPDGFRYSDGERSLHVRIFLDERRFDEGMLREESGASVRAFQPVSPWPFVGVVAAWRGPPDPAAFDRFVQSFKVERR